MRTIANEHSEWYEEQLDLFTDNRRTIWHNQAYDALRGLGLAQALACYDKISAASLADQAITAERSTVAGWQERLSRYQDSLHDAGTIHDLYSEITDALPTPLKTALLAYCAAELLACDTPELVYVPPRFHAGLIFHDLRQFDQAQTWLCRAIAHGIQPLGKFLAFHGDALFRLGSVDLAREQYQTGFFTDPDSIELRNLEDDAVQELLSLIGTEVESLQEELAWLPIWGWLHNIFPLNLNEFSDIRTTWKVTTGHGLSAAQNWHYHLRFAEYLRTVSRNDQELIKVRRHLKELNKEMFERYMQKIDSKRSSYSEK